MSPSGVVALVDLKGFRHVNKELTPRGGDSVLAQMAGRLKKSLEPAGGEISRYSADTFLALLPGMSMGQAQKVLAAAMEALESQPFHYSGVDAHVTPVAGAATCPEDGKASEELLLKAQEALAAAKKGPGGKVLFFAELGLPDPWKKMAT